MQEQRERVCSSNPAERLAAALLIPGVLAERLRELNDVHLGQVLEHEVCSNLSVLAPELTVCMEAAERLRRSALPLARRTQSRAQRSRMAKWDNGEHVLSAEIALYRAGIPCLQLPWQINRFASSTFLVTNIAEARACLLQAGFRKTPLCSTVFIDSQTRKPIRLYEDKLRSAQLNS
jgi:hypothetical protein